MPFRPHPPEEDAPVTPSAQNGGRQRPGFTLLEIMVTMVIIGVMMGVAFIRLDPRRNEADAGITVVRSVIEQAMRNSVQRQYNIMVSFDTVGQRLRYVEDVNNNTAIDAGERVVWKPIENNMRFAAPPAVLGGGYAPGAVLGGNIRTVSGLPTIIARRSGALSTDLQVFITSRRGARGDFRGIIVAQPTGRVEVFTYGSTSWSQLRR